MACFFFEIVLVGLTLLKCSVILATKEHHPKCARIVSINVPIEDPQRAIENFGVRADIKKAIMNSKPDGFRLVDKGLMGIKGTVSLQSLDKPNHYLRHKNYRFRLQKFQNTTVYAKDATFYVLRVKENPPLYAFELVSHPTWFLKHGKRRPYKILLRRVDENTPDVMDSTFFLSRVPCPEKQIAKKAVKKTNAPRPFSKNIDSDSGVHIETEDDLPDGAAKKPTEESISTATDNSQSEDIVTEMDAALKSGSEKHQYLQKLEKDIEEKVKKLTKQVQRTEKSEHDNNDLEGKVTKVQKITRKVPNTGKVTVSHAETNANTASQLGKNKKQDTVIVGTAQEHSQQSPEVTEIVKNVEVKKGGKMNNQVTITESVTNKDNEEGDGLRVKVDSFPLDDTTKEDKINIGKSVNVQTEEKSDPAQLDPVLKITDGNEVVINSGNNLNKVHLSAIPTQHQIGVIVDTPQLKKPVSANRTQGTHNTSYANFANARKIIDHEKLKLKQILNSIDLESGKKIKWAPFDYKQLSKDNLASISSGQLRKMKEKIHAAGQILKAQIKHHENLAQSVPLSLVQVANSSINESLTDHSFLKPIEQHDAKFYYTSQCKDAFPEACKEWAKENYCLTFGALMKRYCRSACRLCDNVLTTGFTHCDKTCGGGRRFRMIKVNNREVLQKQACNTQSCPVNGGYSPFSNFSECSVTCGKGVRYRHRTCNHPVPKFGGKDCSELGPPVETRTCHSKPCKNSKDTADETAELGSNTDQPFDNEDEEPGITVTQGSGEDEAKNDEQQLDYGNPEYTVDNLSNFKFKAPKKGQYFRKYAKAGHPIILNHLGNDLYEHQGHKGEKIIYNIDKHYFNDGMGPYTHTVSYNGEEVARLKCGPSQFMRFSNHVLNSPTSAALQQDNNRISQLFKTAPEEQNMRVINEGKLAYDKYGLPVDTTKAVVATENGPYRIVLSHGKNNKMEVSEQCIESDAAVNPENYIDESTNQPQDTSQSHEQDNHLYGAVSSPNFSPVRTTKKLDSGRNSNGMYEYKYETDPSYHVQTQPDLKRTLSKVVDDENHKIIEKTLKENDHVVKKPGL